MIGKREREQKEDLEVDTKRIKGWTTNQDLPQAISKELRDFFGITALSNGKIPQMQPSFKSMLIPKALIKYLKNELHIEKPNSLQMQLIPAILDERDVISIGSQYGKTFSYVIPVVMRAFQQELTLTFEAGESPNTVVIVENAEEGIKVQKLMQGMAAYLHKKDPTLFKPLSISLSTDAQSYKQPTHILLSTVASLLSSHDSLLDTQLFILTHPPTHLHQLSPIINSGLRLTKPQLILFSPAPPPLDIALLFKGHPAAKTLPDPLICLYNTESPGLAHTYQYATVMYEKYKFTYNARKEERLQDAYEVMVGCADRRVMVAGGNRGEVEEFMDYMRIKEYKGEYAYLKNRETDLKKARVIIATDQTLKGLELPHDIEVLINYDIPDQLSTYLIRLGFLAHKLTPLCLKEKVRKEREVYNFVNRQSSMVTLGEIKAKVLEREKIKVPEFMRDLKGTKEQEKEEVTKYFKELIQSI